MEPLARAPKALLADVAGVIFDVDDTVTRHGRLELEAYGAMWKLADAGVPLAAVTGRPIGWADVFARQWPIAVAVGENGAGWVVCEDGAITEGFFHDEETRARHAEALERIRVRVARELPSVRVANDQRARRADLAFDVGETTKLDDETLKTLLAIIVDEGGRAPVPVSSVHAHAVMGEWDKARGTVRALWEVLDVSETEAETRWLFVGDSGNDAAAFAFFERTVGVANVVDHVANLPQPPRWIAEADRGRGFAEVAEAILSARG
jgi:HAD superfamily hydrolase (TIGR01484 family)